jgi:glutathione S-transferase
VIEKSRRDSDRVMAILDSHLANRAFVAAERFTIAECALAPFVHRWLNLPMAREPRPNVERWYASIMQRPAARKVLILPLS